MSLFYCVLSYALFIFFVVVASGENRLEKGMYILTALLSPILGGEVFIIQEHYQKLISDYVLDLSPLV